MIETILFCAAMAAALYYQLRYQNNNHVKGMEAWFLISMWLMFGTVIGMHFEESKFKEFRQTNCRTIKDGFICKYSDDGDTGKNECHSKAPGAC